MMMGMPALQAQIRNSQDSWIKLIKFRESLVTRF